MNVVVLTNMFPTPEKPSYGVFVKEQVEDLCRLGASIRVLAFDGAKRRGNYLSAGREIRRIVGDRDVDLVHAHYGLSGAVALAQRRVPVVTTFHGSDCSGRVAWQTAVSWVVARRCTPVFVAPQLAARLGRPLAAVIPAAVDTEVFQPLDRREARRSLGWDEDGHVALLPGSRSTQLKRADLFDAAIESARRSMPDLRGVSLEGLARADVAAVLNAVDVTVMTSDHEGSPVVVKESLACATPVVSVLVGDVPSLLAGLPGCAIVPRDAEQLGAAIVVALDADRAPALRTRAEEFSRARIAARVMRVYEQALERSRR